MDASLIKEVRAAVKSLLSGGSYPEAFLNGDKIIFRGAAYVFSGTIRIRVREDKPTKALKRKDKAVTEGRKSTCSKCGKIFVISKFLPYMIPKSCPDCSRKRKPRAASVQ